jgi:hypothetical protein
MALLDCMSVNEIIAELPKLSDKERKMVLEKLVDLDADFAPTPAMSEAIRDGLSSLAEEKTYSATDLRARISEWVAQ